MYVEHSFLYLGVSSLIQFNAHARHLFSSAMIICVRIQLAAPILYQWILHMMRMLWTQPEQPLCVSDIESMSSKAQHIGLDHHLLLCDVHMPVIATYA